MFIFKLAWETSWFEWDKAHFRSTYETDVYPKIKNKRNNDESFENWFVNGSRKLIKEANK